MGIQGTDALDPHSDRDLLYASISDMLKQRRNCAEFPDTDASTKEKEDSRRKLWVPFFLQRSTMLVFLFSFLAVLGTLIALFVYTQRQGRSLGIKTDVDRYYYLWTYGPTAGMNTMQCN